MPDIQTLVNTVGAIINRLQTLRLNIYLGLPITFRAGTTRPYGIVYEKPLDDNHTMPDIQILVNTVGAIINRLHTLRLNIYLGLPIP